MNPKELKIMIVEDHPIMLSGLLGEFERHGYHHLTSANNGAKALESIIQTSPDIVLMDLEIPLLSGFEVIERCMKQNLSVKFIILTYHKEKGFMLKAQNLGISGYLLKEDSFTEIEIAIEEAMKGSFYFSSSIDDQFKDAISQEARRLSFLTSSERTIVRMIANELSSREISDNLLISLRTVQKHRSNIIQKLGLSSGSDPLTEWVKKNAELIKDL